MARDYDDEARATGWRGPDLAYDLVRDEVRAGQSILDIGIGTGLAAEVFHRAGLKVHGMDLDERMLEASRAKGITVDLRRHDLTLKPYPYESESLDHAVCVGVLNFIRDLGPVFEESSRILRPGGIFVFEVGDRQEGESGEFAVEAGQAKTGAQVTMYRHSPAQIDDWLEANGFQFLRSVVFTIVMDADGSRTLAARATVAQKSSIPK